MNTREILELLNRLMCCEHMGDVCRVVHELGRKMGVPLKSGQYDNWHDESWAAIEDALQEHTK
jgi:hypothetical protein